MRAEKESGRERKDYLQRKRERGNDSADFSSHAAPIERANERAIFDSSDASLPMPTYPH